MSGVATDLVAVAERLRTHPDVRSGPSVRALLAGHEVYHALGHVVGAQPHVDQLLRAALLTLPHRLRVRPGVDAADLVREAVRAVVLPTTVLGVADAEDDSGVAEVRERPVFSLDAAPDNDPRTQPGGPGPAPAVEQVLAHLLHPVRRGPMADGRTRSPGRPAAGARGAPAPMHPGDRRRDLSVRATLRAAARSGGTPEDSLRVRPPLPDVACDVVLCLDVSQSMAGAAVAPLARSLIDALTRDTHRVGLVVFSSGTTDVCGLTRDPAVLRSAAAAYEPANPTNLESAIWAGQRMLTHTGARARPGIIVLLTDADPTVCGTPVRPARGAGAAGARLAALTAAGEARAAGIAVSVLAPRPQTVARVDLEFAGRLAAAGGGRAACFPKGIGTGVAV
jgi:Mg-chelatase subunit ChlD